MVKMTRFILRWSLRGLVGLLALFAAWLFMICYPSPLFAHVARFEGYTVYSDRPIEPDMSRTIDGLAVRVAAMDRGSPGGTHRIYLCHSPRRYAFYAFLARLGPESLAIGLSVPNETFVSMGRVERFAALNGGRLRHTRFEGDLSEVVAHEIAHFNARRGPDPLEHGKQPLWKTEGWAEYQANLAAIRADPDYDLRSRIDILNDDDYWGRWHPGARRMWEAQLLVEYLAGVEGYGHADLAREDVTRPAALAGMMRWYASGNGGPASF